MMYRALRNFLPLWMRFLTEVGSKFMKVTDDFTVEIVGHMAFMPR